MTTTLTDRLDGVTASLALKAPVVAASTANITLSGEQTIEGVSCVAGNRVLVMGQTTASENGIYDVETGAWSRSKDFDGNRDIVCGTRVYITGGTTYTGYEAQVTTENPITIGTSSISFSLLLILDSGTATDVQTCADNIAAIQGASTQAANAASSAAAALVSETNAAASEVAAEAAAVSAIGYRWGTSTTSLAIATGDKTFTTQAGLGLLNGAFVMCASDAAAANYMHGQVKTYSDTTLVVDVQNVGGTGARADWNISPSGPQGGSGEGTGTVNAGTSTQIAYYAGSGTAVSGGDAATILGLLGTLPSIDEDDMASDSDTNLPTQQSVKAYVDALVAASGKQLFTSSGTFTVPAGITTVYISGSGGGGGGGGSYYTGDGSSGGTTSFGVLVSLTGGTGGKGAYVGGGGGGSSAGGNYNGGNGSVQDTTAANGGVGGGRGGGKGGLYVGGGASAASAALANSGSGGGGGAVVKSSVPLAGGGGGAGQTQPPTAYTVTAEASYTVTIGAAGGGGSGGGSSHVAGGSGAAGWLLVEW